MTRRSMFLVVAVCFSCLVSGSVQAANISVSVNAGTGDARENRSDNVVKITSKSLDMVDHPTNGNQYVGFQFSAIAIPKGAFITNAYIQLTSDTTSNSATADFIIAGENTGSALPFTAVSGDISGRPLTTSSVTWSPPQWSIALENGPNEQTPALTTIVQEIVGRPDWDTGNSMAFVVTGAGWRVACAYEGFPASTAQLNIWWIMTNRYTITATAEANGSISPAGAVEVGNGSNKTFTITADANYDITNVTVDGGPVGIAGTYTFTNVTTNHSINAQFGTNVYIPPLPTSTLPYTNSFETYDPGYPIVGDDGWAVSDYATNAAVIAEWSNWSSNHPTVFFPASSPHAAVLNVAGTVSSSFTVDNTADFVYIDVCVKPQLRDSPPTDQVTPTPPQAAAYFNSQGNLVFYFKWFDTADPLGVGWLAPTWDTNTLVTISTNEWVHLTFEMAYQNYADDANLMGYYGDCFYRIRINEGTNYYTNLHSYAIQHLLYGDPQGTESDPAPTPRTWFMCANSSGDNLPPNTLHSFTVSGYAQVDDLVVSANPLFSIDNPSVMEPGSGTTNMVFTATLSRICPADVSLVFNTVPGSGNANAGVDYLTTTGTVTITAGQLSGSIVVPVVKGPAPNGTRDFSLELRRQYLPQDLPNDQGLYNSAAHATGQGTILESSASYTAHGTPTLWLDAYGVVAGDYEAADATDSDNDGMANWQEYWAGTNPTNTASVFKVTSISGTTNFTLTWIGSTNDITPPMPPWRIYRTTNMLGDPNIVWTNLPSASIARDTHILDSTHYRWTDPAGTSYGQRVFYKVTTTTNAP